MRREKEKGPWEFYNVLKIKEKVEAEQSGSLWIPI